MYNDPVTALAKWVMMAAFAANMVVYAIGRWPWYVVLGWAVAIVAAHIFLRTNQ